MLWGSGGYDAVGEWRGGCCGGVEGRMLEGRMLWGSGGYDAAGEWRGGYDALRVLTC